MCDLKLLSLYSIIFLIAHVQSTVFYNNGIGVNPYQSGHYPLNGNTVVDNYHRKCPLCDSSVYSYCSDKLFHDSCCCYRPMNPFDRLPYECQYADCGFLHANTCREHELITACCCATRSLIKK